MSDSFIHKIFKISDISSFYFRRYAWDLATPEPNINFLQAFQNNNKNLFYKLLFDFDDFNNIIIDANRLCHDEFKIFSIDPNTISKNFSWHKDFYTNYLWPISPFNRIYYRNDSGGDINIPWELSRLQFLPTLLAAWKYSGNTKYLNQIMYTINNWISNNPFCFGINWLSGMDIGLRAVNLVMTISFLWKTLPQKILNKYLSLIWKHAFYIYKYDIYHDSIKNKNNHYIGSLVGLFICSLCFKGKIPNFFALFSIQKIKQEIIRQFNEDGGNFESSTAYHQFSVELIIIFLLIFPLLKETDNDLYNNKMVENDVLLRLYNGIQFISDYMACFNRSPNIGDSSDCRALIVSKYFDRKPWDHSYLLNMASQALNISPDKRSNRFSKIYPKSGYCFIKRDLYGLVAFAGPKGTNEGGGHGHNDKTSFVLHIRNFPVFIDSGTYIYNFDTIARFSFKSTKAHNTLMIDDIEQCHIDSKIVFGIPGKINSNISLQDDENDRALIIMGHNGYSRFPWGGRVFRNIICHSNSIEIDDIIHGNGKHKVSIMYNLHPSVKPEIFFNTVNLSVAHKLCTIHFSDNFCLRIENSLFSEAYHDYQSTKRIIAIAEETFPFRAKTKINFANT